MSPRRASLAVLLILAGCVGSRPTDVSQENDKLRKANLDLRREVDRVKSELAARVTEKDALQQQLGRQPKVDGGELLGVTSIRFGRYSGPVDTNGDGRDDKLRIYLLTLDAHERFMPASGKAELTAAQLVDGAEPNVVAQQSLSGKQLDSAYRSGITGTHYTIETAMPAGLDHVAVRVTLTDAATGAQLTHQQSFRVQ